MGPTAFCVLGGTSDDLVDALRDWKMPVVYDGGHPGFWRDVKNDTLLDEPLVICDFDFNRVSVELVTQLLRHPHAICFQTLVHPRDWYPDHDFSAVVTVLFDKR